MKTIKASFLGFLAFAVVAGAPFTGAQARLVGITPDSEYLLFIVDSSGSMRRYEWDRLAATMRDTIAMYPDVKGIQVINDQGEHLLISYRNEWIPITAPNLEWIFEEIANWESYSTSNPRRGLLAAIDRYYDPEKAIAIFLLSDDFSAGAEAIDGLVADVDARNRERAAEVPRVRIHSVAFPVFYDVLGRDQFVDSTGAALATLMSTLSQRNDGRFLALSSRHVDGESVVTPGAEDIPAGANRVLILVDTSVNMREPYWRQAVEAVNWLLQELDANDSFQVLVLTDSARPILAGSEGQWLSNADGSQSLAVVQSLRETTPAGTVDLGAATAALRGLGPAPDYVYVLVAGDPGLVGPRDFPRVEFANPGGAPIDVLLFGARDTPQAVPFYWALALAGGGSLIAPAEDWP